MFLVFTIKVDSINSLVIVVDNAECFGLSQLHQLRGRVGCDAELRGSGELSGTQQSGVLELSISNLVTDKALLSEARNSVIAIFKEEVTLSLPQSQILAYSVNQKNPGISRDKVT